MPENWVSHRLYIIQRGSKTAVNQSLGFGAQHQGLARSGAGSPLHKLINRITDARQVSIGTRISRKLTNITK